MLRRLTLACVLLLGAPFAGAQGPAGPPQPTAATAAPMAGPEELRSQVASGLESLKDAQGELDDKNPAVASYREAERLLARIDELRAAIAGDDQSAQEAPARREAIEKELAQPASEPRIEPDPNATLSQLEQQLSQARAQLEAARQQVVELSNESSRREARRTEIPKEIAAERQTLENLDASLAATGGTVPAEEPARSQRLLQMVQRLHSSTLISRLERESAGYEARRELLPKRRDLAQRRVTEAEKVAAAWEQVVSARRQEEAEAAARQAELLRREAARQHPVLKNFADENAQYAKELNDLQSPNGTPSLSQQKDAVIARTNELKQNMAKLRTRVDRDRGRLTDATGLLLRRRYASLGDIDAIERTADSIGDRLRNIEYRIQEIEEPRDAVGDDAEALRALLDRVEADPTPVANLDDLTTVARDLIKARRDYLEKLKTQLDQTSDGLRDLQDEYDRYLKELRADKQYFEERILWVRSVVGSPVPRPADAGEAFGWLSDPARWREAITASWDEAKRIPGAFGGICFVVAALIAFRLYAPALLKRTASKVASFRTDRFSYTLLALIVSAVMALPVPACLWAAAWFLDLPAGPGELPRATAMGLREASVILYALTMARIVLRDDGVGNAHFAWHTEGVRTLRRHLRWFIPAIAALWALVIMLDRQSESDLYNDSLGRAGFIGAMIAMSVFLSRILRPRGPVMSPILAERKERWLWRLRFVWYSLAVGIPIILIGLTLLRYYYTALRLQVLLFHTLWLVGVLVLLSSLMGRWLFIVRRRLAIETARRKREQLKAAAAEAEKISGDPAATASPPPPPAVDPNAVDIPALDSRMRQAVGTGIGLAFLLGMAIIWTDVLPALRMLNRVQLWPTPAIVDPAAATPPSDGARGDGDKATESAPESSANPLTGGMQPASDETKEHTKSLRLTLGDLGLAILFGVITVLAVRNLPAVVELILLQHLPLDTASRYALVSVFRYALAIIGVTATMGAIGISWSTVQWLAAALTFGLAFGLQEIFANFVSGLIILAERPIRVGDMVTVGDIDGSVTKIRMRATTILAWDRKELIIPNKQFITDRVINWTLSDSIQRIAAPVGVAYGSDLAKVERTLMEACRSVPNILSDPGPAVLFRGFGDSTLNWEARVFVNGVDQLVEGRNYLNKKIDALFRREGIEIAFPQMDLHLRSSEELADLVVRVLPPESPGKLPGQGGPDAPGRA